MASIYPSFEVIKRLKVQPTAGEKKLLKLLYNSLDDRFGIYFQPYLGGDRPDIILLNKEAGVLIFEVKDWDIPILFLIIDDETELEKAELIYTGITRARYRLFIINSINNPYHQCFFKNIRAKYDNYSSLRKI